MPPTPLPHFARSHEQAQLHSFLNARLEPRAGITKALFVSGRAGVGKRTLVRHVVGSDPRFRAYRFLDPATRAILGNPSTGRTQKAFSRGAEALGHLLSLPYPTAAAAYNVALTLAGDHVFRADVPLTDGRADLSVLDETREPVLAVVPPIDLTNLETLRYYTRLVRETRNREIPLALLFLDDDVKHIPEESGTSYKLQEEFQGRERFRSYLGDDSLVEALTLRAFSERECCEAFGLLGLSQSWGSLFFQLSDGGLAELDTIWRQLQKQGIIVTADRGRWKSTQSPATGFAWTLITNHLLELIRPRMPLDSVHEGRLETGFFLAASMGSAFLPQAVAECVLQVDPKRNEVDADTWEDLWYEVLEREDPEHPALATARRHGDWWEDLQADDARYFVYRFRDSALPRLLRIAAGQMWRQWETYTGAPEQRPHIPFGNAIGALQGWLAQKFQTIESEALPFRTALLRIQGRDRDATPLEDRLYRLRLLESLAAQAERGRSRVAEGEDARELYACLLWYGKTLHDGGHYEAAADAFREAKQLVDDRRVSLSGADKITLLSRLGIAWRILGRYSEAEPLLNEALNTSIQFNGLESLETLTNLHNLGTLYIGQGRYEEAESRLGAALEGRARLLGWEHRDTLLSANNLGALYYQQGKYEAADPWSRRCLEGLERELGPDHVDTVLAALNLGILVSEQGRYEEAEPLLRRALDGMDRKLGPDHPHTLSSGHNLSKVYHRQGRYEEAEALLRRALQGRERVAGWDSPDTLASAHYLALVYYDQGRYDKAQRLALRTLEGRERVLGPDHKDTHESAHNLGVLYYVQGRHEEAEALLRRAIEGSEQFSGRDSPAALNSCQALASVLHDQGRYHEAEQLLRRATNLR